MAKMGKCFDSSRRIDLVNELMGLHNDKWVRFVRSSSNTLINSQTLRGNSALHLTSWFGSKEMAKILLEAGANTRLQNKFGDTPLHIALRGGMDRAEVAEVILDADPGNGLRNQDGETTLHCAAATGNIDFVRKLLENGSNPCIQNLQGETPLHYALENKHDSVAVVLINAYTLTFIQDGEGMSLLHHAADAECENAVRKLLTYGASTRLQDRYGQTPLHIALRCEAEFVALAILNTDAENDIKDAVGMTPLLIAAERGHENAVRILLSFGANTRCQDSYLQTPLHIALEECRESVALLIVRTDAENDMQNHCGKTPLHLAAEWGFEEVVRKLLSSGARTRLQDRYGHTPLHGALRYNRLSAALLILNTDAENSIQDEDGNTPLHLAAEETQTDQEMSEISKIVKELLFSDVHPHVKNNDRKTPLEIAMVSEQNQIANIVLSICILRNISVKWEGMKVPQRSIQLCIPHIAQCSAEIQHMKETKVAGTSFTYYEAATKHVNKLALCLENDLIRSTLFHRTLDNWTLDFPIYGELILFKLEKAEKKRILRTGFFQCFASLSDRWPALPSLSVEVILSYLTDREVQKFIQAFHLNV